MASLAGFNANEVEPRKPFEPLPAGHYDVAIVESEMKPTKNGLGEYLELRMQVLTGEYENRKLFARLNLNNPSDQAVGIARAELSAICRALNRTTPNDSSELHNLPMVVKVTCKADRGSGEISNQIGGYFPDGYKPGAQVATTPKPAAAAPAAKPTAAAWMKK